MNNKTYSLNESRFARMINSDNKSDAIYMGVWDTFKDFFRSEKKSEILSTLYDLLHAEDNLVTEEDTLSGLYLGDVTLFKKLTSFAKESCKDLFTTSFDQNRDTISFHIGNSTLKTVSLVDTLKSIKINGELFIDDYDSILRKHRYLNGGEQSGSKVEGADDLRRISSSFYQSYLELFLFLKDCGITQDAVFDRAYDLLGKTDSNVDQDKACRRQYYFSTIYNNLTTGN